MNPFTQRVFVVSFRFMFCGTVFTDGLKNAADNLSLTYAEAAWDDPQLQEKIKAFKPDLLFVVHGRKFIQKWKAPPKNCHSAVWLVDEPYEVDDTSKWSSCFDTVFINDPATLGRHRNAHYLPVCFDPTVHKDAGLERKYLVGFVGSYSAIRDRFLAALVEAGVLSYVVGGPWKTAAVQHVCQAQRVPANQTALLYQKTQIILNVFRETHHYNAQRIPAGSLNPRLYEAVACGAAVITERRSEVSAVFPEMPQLDTPGELVTTVQTLLSDRTQLDQLRTQCKKRLVGNSYQDRLERVLTLTSLVSKI